MNLKKRELMGLLYVIALIFSVIFSIFIAFYAIYFSLMILSTRKKMSVKKTNSYPVVSLVIPAHNESEGIIQKLQNSVSLKYPNDKLEIIVVDDGSTDNTCQLVKDFINKSSCQIKVNLFSLPEWSGKATALNYAWARCTGEIVAITDADITLEEDAIQMIVRNFGNPDVGAVTGRLCVGTGNSQTVASEKNYRSIFNIIRIGESNIDSTPIFNGLIMAFRRGLLDNLDPSVIADDTELAMLLREKGWRAIFDNDVIAYEHVSESQKIRAKQKLRRGRGIVQSFIRHRKMLFNKKYGKYGLIIFPSEFFMHIVSPLLLVMLFATFIPLVILYSLSSSTMAYIFILTLVLLPILIFLPIQQLINSKKITINPISIILSFLTHELYLVVILFSYFLRSLHITGKNENIRNAWKTKS